METPKNIKHTPTVFDHNILRRNRKRAAHKFAKYDFLFSEVKNRLDERLAEITRKFTSPFHLAYPLMGEQENEQENLCLKPQSFDLITNNLQLHWASDLPGVLIQINRALIPDGLFLASMFGGDTLIELKTCLLEAEIETNDKAMMRTSPMADVRDLGGLMMRAGFALPLVDVDRIIVKYKNIESLMHDLRYMGEGNALSSRPKTLRRDTLAKAQEIYMKKFPHSDGDGICATFDVVFLTGWSAHESQPQPLKPGSATVNLADVLGDKKTDL